jgi:hypothetical protein
MRRGLARFFRGKSSRLQITPLASPFPAVLIGGLYGVVIKAGEETRVGVSRNIFKANFQTGGTSAIA